MNNLVFLLLPVLFFQCKSQTTNTEEKHKDEYLVKFREGTPYDTALVAIFKYNKGNKLVEEKRFSYGAENSLKYYYDTNINEIDTNSNHPTVFIMKSKFDEKRYFEGRIFEESLFDTMDNLLQKVFYGIDIHDIRKLVKKYFYEYNEFGKIKREVMIVDNDTIYEAQYTYDSKRALTEKYYKQNKCCSNNQPIPYDRIVYENNNSGQPFKEINIIDSSIKRSYKDMYHGYFNEVKIISYSYDEKGRLSEVKTFVPNNSLDRKNFSELFKANIVQEVRFYKYNNTVSN